MFRIAFPRGQGPAAADLPPTLQPCAIAASAPASDHLRAASIAGLIYVVLAAATAGLASLAPHRILVPAGPSEKWRPVTFVVEPSVTHPTFHPVSTWTGGGAFTTVPVTQPPAPPEASGEAAAGLPTEDHSRDPVGPGTGTPGIPTPPGSPPGPPLGSPVHDFTSVGLAVLRQVDPAYPDFARRARVQGTVVLLMTVDEAGRPLRVQVLEGHPVFHEAAVQAARQWRFEPARVDGQAVSAAFRLTLKFSLR